MNETISEDPLIEEWRSYFKIENSSNAEQLHDLFSNYFKKRQISDLISSLIQFINGNLKKQSIKRLPVEILDKFALFCQHLPPTESVKLWNLLMKNIPQLLSSKSKHSEIALTICVDLLTRLMMNTKFHDHNISQFEELVGQLRDTCLGSLLMFCLENRKKKSVLSSTLVLCHVWGEITLFLEEYYEVDFKRETNSASLGSNLSYVHSYFDDWKEILAIVKRDNELMYNYGLLVLQKIRSLDVRKKEVETKLIENSAKLLWKMGNKCGDESHENRSIWLLILNNVSLLIPYWSTDIVYEFCKLIINEKKNFVNEKLFELDKFQNSFVTIIWERVSSVSTEQPIFEKLANFFNENTKNGEIENHTSSRSLFFQLGKEIEEILENKEEKMKFNNENELEEIFKIFELVPMMCLSKLNQKRCLIGIFALVAKFTLRNDFLSFCFQTISKILSKEQTEVEIFNFVTVGVVLKWLTREKLKSAHDSSDFDANGEVYVELLDRLLHSSLSSKNRWNKTEVYFVYLKKTGKTKKWAKMNEVEKRFYTVTLSHLLENIKKIMKQDGVHKNAKEFFELHRTKLFEIIVECAKNTNFDPADDVFMPFLVNLSFIGSEREVLEKNPELKTEFEQQIKSILPSAVELLPKIEDSKIMNFFRFFNCASKIDSDFHDVLITFWSKLKSMFIDDETDENIESDVDKTISTMINLCDKNDVQKICEDLLNLTIQNSSNGGSNEFIRCLKLWKLIPFNIKDEEKSKILRSVAGKLLVIFPHIIRNFDQKSPRDVLILIMTITEYILRPHNLLEVNFSTFPFHIFMNIIESKCEFENTQHFADIFNGLFLILNAFCVNHADFIANKVPLLIKCISSLMQLLLRRSDETKANIDEIDLKILENCAMNLNRLLYQFGNTKLNFLRVAHYLVADYVFELENIILNSAIKEILINGIYSVLDLCDEFAVIELQKNLPAPSRELFSQLYSDFTRDHKFKQKQKRVKKDL